MHLKRLEIQGFKSFAKRTELDFQPGITAIVGPNGSGKSNLSDALRWVLGEQSPKLMRGKKSDDVIFAGSDQKTRAGFAEVVATFENLDRRIPVDAPEVSLGRRVSRSGESEYLINGQKVRLLDIVDLVLRSGIGTSRYTVIGQGTIDQMILAGPVEVKNLLDEASGVKTYYIKRDKALKRLETTTQNLTQAKQSLAELEPKLKTLRRLAKKIDQREVIVSELQVLERQYYGAQWWQIADQLQMLQVMMQPLEQRVQQQEQAMASMVQNLQMVDRQSQERILELQTLQTKLNAAQREKNALLEQQSVFRGQMQAQSAEGDPQAIQAELQSLGAETDQLRRELAAIELQIGELSRKETETKQQLQQITQDWDLLLTQQQKPEVGNAAWKQNFEKCQNLLTDLQNILEDAQVSVEQVKIYFDRFFSAWKLIEVSSETEPMVDSAKIRQLSSTKDEVQQSLYQFRQELAQMQAREQELKVNVSLNESKQRQLQVTLSKLGTEPTSEQMANVLAEERVLQAKLDAAIQVVVDLESLMAQMQQTDIERKQGELDLNRQLRDIQAAVNQDRTRLGELQVQMARELTKQESCHREMLDIWTVEVIESVKQTRVESVAGDVWTKIRQLRTQLEQLGGVDEATVVEYHETENAYSHLSTQIADLDAGMADVRMVLDELDEQIRRQFHDAFQRVNESFGQYFQTLFNGGKAYLSVLEDKNSGEDEEAESVDGQVLSDEQRILAQYQEGMVVYGVDIKATPPGKKLASIQALSGGERALTAIALLCSLLKCFPSPCVVLDEVDAALDEANTVRFGQILGSLSHQTQFVAITHNRETMAQAHTLYGVTMGGDGISQLLSIKMDQAVVYAK